MNKANLKQDPLSLGSLVQYQDGSVVSRTLLSKSSGSVTLFAFDKGQSLSEHTTPFDALALAVEGELDITIMDERNQLSAGDILFLPANKPHAVRATKRCKMLLIMIQD